MAPLTPSSKFLTVSDPKGTQPASSAKGPSVGTAFTPPLLYPSEEVI